MFQKIKKIQSNKKAIAELIKKHSIKQEAESINELIENRKESPGEFVKRKDINKIAPFVDVSVLDYLIKQNLIRYRKMGRGSFNYYSSNDLIFFNSILEVFEDLKNDGLIIEKTLGENEVKLNQRQYNYYLIPVNWKAIKNAKIVSKIHAINSVLRLQK